MNPASKNISNIIVILRRMQKNKHHINLHHHTYNEQNIKPEGRRQKGHFETISRDYVNFSTAIITIWCQNVYNNNVNILLNFNFVVVDLCVRVVQAHNLISSP